MSEVKRWNPCLQHGNNPSKPTPAMQEDSTSGRFVLHSDHLAAVQALEARVAELEKEKRVIFDKYLGTIKAKVHATSFIRMVLSFIEKEESPARREGERVLAMLYEEDQQ